jgi:Flp pilus assembly pilin Flp
LSGDAVGRRLWRDAGASVATEYALVAAIVAIFAIAGLLAFSDAVGGLWGEVAAEAGDAMAAPRPAPPG